MEDSQPISPAKVVHFPERGGCNEICAGRGQSVSRGMRPGAAALIVHVKNGEALGRIRATQNIRSPHKAELHSALQDAGALVWMPRNSARFWSAALLRRFRTAHRSLGHGRTGRVGNSTACGRLTKRNSVPHSKTLTRWFGCHRIPPGFGDFDELSRAVRRACAAFEWPSDHRPNTRLPGKIAMGRRFGRPTKRNSVPHFKTLARFGSSPWRGFLPQNLRPFVSSRDPSPIQQSAIKFPFPPLPSSSTESSVASPHEHAIPMNRDCPPRYHLRWAISLFFIALAAKLWFIHRSGSPVPYCDQWDAEAQNTFIPWFEGRFRLADFFGAHGQHRIFFTRTCNLVLMLLNGQWDNRVECV